LQPIFQRIAAPEAAVLGAKIGRLGDHSLALV
jgi:hypothetical protein